MVPWAPLFTSYYQRKRVSFILLFALAALNDSIDLLGLLNPFLETIFDVFLAIIICLNSGEVNPWLFLITVVDAIPGIDFTPFWTLYVLYLYLKESSKKRVKVKVE